MWKITDHLFDALPQNVHGQIITCNNSVTEAFVAKSLKIFSFSYPIDCNSQNCQTISEYNILKHLRQ